MKALIAAILVVELGVDAIIPSLIISSVIAALTIGGNGNWQSVANSSSAVANILYDEPVLFYVDKENGKSKDFIKEQILSNDRMPFIPRYETPNIRFNHIIKAIPLRKIYKTIIANSTSSVATYGV
mgnify:CR=1 FL=1